MLEHAMPWRARRRRGLCPRGSAAATPGIRGLPSATPIPPLALRRGQPRIAGLGHGGGERIQDAEVLRLSGDAAQPFIEPAGTAAGELGDGADAELLEIAKHGRSDGDEIAELPLCRHRKNLLARAERIC